ncbi:active regulator of SIRT1 isoform X2 [Ambystoma mexicanum]|uniref:active regulator of SIRT1 isoform X2 n=1 Tax=Ambystoma mexicanum TaxID=8296 RepID=UPI0037E918E5
MSSFQAASESAGNSAKRGKKTGMEPPGNKKTGARRHRQQVMQQDKSTVKGKVVKSAIDEYLKRHRTDNMQRNLQIMLGSKFVTDGAVTKEVQRQNRGRKASDRIPEKPKEKEEPGIFTDSDFKRFEREYFGGGAGST